MNRVGGVLAVTRAFGDHALRDSGLTAVPHILKYTLKPFDKFLVIASDGIWDRFSNQEVMMLIAKQYYPTRDADGAAAHLVRESVDRWQSE